MQCCFNGVLAFHHLLLTSCIIALCIKGQILADYGCIVFTKPYKQILKYR